MVLGKPLHVRADAARTLFLRLRLAGTRPALGPQPLDLGARQGHADLADPIQFHRIDRLGVETREIDRGRRLSALDRLQVALAGLEADRGLLAIKARQRMTLLAIDHDDVPAL